MGNEVVKQKRKKVDLNLTREEQDRFELFLRKTGRKAASYLRAVIIEKMAEEEKCR